MGPWRICLLGLLPALSPGLQELPERVREPAWLDRPQVLAQVPDPGGMAWMVKRAVNASGDLALVWWDEVEGAPGGFYRAQILRHGSRAPGASFRLSGELELCFGRPGLDFVDADGALGAWVCRKPRESGWLLQVGRVSRSPAEGSKPVTLATSERAVLRDPVVVGGGGEGALVLWRSTIGGSRTGELHAQRVDARGRPLGPARVLGGAHSGRSDTPPRAASFAEGGYLVTWVAGGSVTAQRLDAAGAPLGPPTVVNDRGSDRTEAPSVATTGRGRALIAWSGRAEGGQGTSLWARWVDDGGTPGAGAMELVRAGRPGGARVGPVELAAGPQGDFLAVWRGAGAGSGISGRWFDGSTGLPLERAFGLDAGRDGDWPHVGPWSERGMLVSWLTEVSSAGAAVQELRARLVLPRRPASLPRSPAEVECEGTRLREALAGFEVVGGGQTPRLLAGAASEARRIVALAATAAPLDDGGDPPGRSGRSWGWSRGAAQGYVLTESRSGGLTRRAIPEGPDPTVELERRAGPGGGGDEEEDPEERGSALRGARSPRWGTIPEPCHGKRTERDVLLAQALIASLRPLGPPGEYVLTAFRGPGVDTFWVELLARDERGSLTDRFSVAARFQWDGAGELRGLELSGLPGCGQARRTGCTRTGRPLGLAVSTCSQQGGPCEPKATIHAHRRGVVRLRPFPAPDRRPASGGPGSGR